MRRLLAYFVDHSLVVNALLLAVCLVGWVTFRGMPRDLMPKRAKQKIEIRGTLPGASAVDTERYVTFPLEEQVHDLPGIKRLESETEAGRFKIEVVFKADHEEMQESLETIRARVGQIRHLLPEDLRPLEIHQRKRDTQNFMYLAVHPVDHHDAEHRKWVESLTDALDKIPHVVRVWSSLPRRDLYIEFDRRAIARYGLDVNRVKQKVLEHLQYQPLGVVDVNFDKVSVELRQRLGEIAALEKLPITRNRVGRGVDLGDLARVRLRSAHHERIERFEGEPFVTIELNKDLGSDILALQRRVEQVVARFNKQLPEPLRVEVIHAFGFWIERPLRLIMKNGLLGLAIVGLVLLLFLGPRVASMAVLGLPFIYLGTFVILDVLGIGIHLVSVIGMLLVIGIVVDDAILVSERFLENREQGLDPRDAALGSARALLRPVSGTVLTNIIVFTPVLLIKHEMTRVLAAIPWVIFAALALSLLESFLILPNHLRHFVPAGHRFKERRFFVRLRRTYCTLLRLTLKLRYLALVGFIGFFAFSLWLFSTMKKTTDVNLNTVYVYVHATVKRSDSLEHTLRQLQPLERIARQVGGNRIKYLSATAGEAYTPNDYKVYGQREAQLEICVDEKLDEPELQGNALARALTRRLSHPPPGFARIEVHRRKTEEQRQANLVTIYVSGGDTLSFEEIQDEIRAVIGGVTGVERIYIDPKRWQRSWQFAPDPRALALYQLDQRSLTQQLRQHTAPQELLRVRHRGEQITVYTHFAQAKELVFAELERLEVISPKGIAVPLSRLGRWKEQLILKEIKHLDLARKFEIDVLYDGDKITTEKIEAQLEQQLAPLRRRYPQYRISVEPPREHAEAMAWVGKLFVTCLVLIYFVLLVVLNSATQPLLVMFAIPFGFSGVVLALHLHGMELGMMAMIGLLGLTGVVVNDSLVMIDTINRRRKELPQEAYGTALLEGASSRLKAVILTSLTTLGGVLPLAYGIGGKVGFAQPMVFALGWGLVFATLLTLFLLPSTLAIVHDFRRGGRWLLARLRRQAPRS